MVLRDDKSQEPDEPLLSSHDAIGAARKRLRTHFENPILLVDTARHFSALGQNDKAKRFMGIALHLAPNHRFVLRAASRLLLHLDKPDEALRLIRRAVNTPGDPWLIAAEISIASVAGKKSTFISRGGTMLKEGRFPPAQITELASAVATVEMSYGNNRIAKKLFVDALVSPNDNTIAQVADVAERLVKQQGTTSAKMVWDNLKPLLQDARQHPKPKNAPKGRLETFDKTAVKEQVGKIVSGD